MAETAGKHQTRDRPRSTPDVAPLGSQNGHKRETQTNAYLMWEEMSFPERLGVILGESKTADWVKEPYLPVLAHFRHDPIQWAAIIIEWHDRGKQPRYLEAAVDEYVRIQDGTSMNAAHPGLPPPETLTHLIADNIPPPRQLFEGLMHEGMLLFGGKSKRGKSWLIFDLAISLAVGRAGFRHYSCPAPMPVLYLALEDGRARLQGRAKAIQPNLKQVDNFHLRYTFPPLAQGGVEALHAEIARYHYGLVIIDVLAKLESSATGKSEKSYHDIYDMFTPLQELRKHHPFCLAMLTHLRKQEADDVFDALMGSVAYQGAQDVLWVLERKPKDEFAFLHIRDKDAEETTIALRFLDGHWQYIGEGEEYEVSRDQRKIIKILADEKKEMGIDQIRRAANWKEDKYGYIRNLLVAMVKDDLIHRTKYGKYSATLRATEEMLPSEDSDHVPF